MKEYYEELRESIETRKSENSLKRDDVFAFAGYLCALHEFQKLDKEEFYSLTDLLPISSAELADLTF